MGQYETALVTGASSGIGRAIALELASAGLKVLALGRDQIALESLCSAAPGIVPVVSDLADISDVYRKIEGETIDVLVNNAGLLTTSASLVDLSEDDIDAMIDINVRSVFKLTRHVLKSMVERRRGHIFFTGSSGGLAPHPNSSVYGATKAAVSLFSSALRCDLLGLPIRVTELVPGRVQTNLYRTALGDEAAQKKLYDDFEAIQPEHMARLLRAALDLPDYIDVTRLEVMPTGQAVGGAQISKLSR
ncbi:SDR family oxidoreductase [Falsochrobactrum sp. TDYN1]|uniref:SDR family oxidoreductase n=1 Tax=Falsochrobactrum tianjinense TaxID=2706015 RepID=A0A949PP97_9HYPH|nr:SDR family oxidoreductase [Falsochrobactrum sp. TDYN1]MBV2144892.1 SDR family oxidoreductase [Falsochrobactrum sp. TDYN1]